MVASGLMLCIAAPANATEPAFADEARAVWQDDAVRRLSMYEVNSMVLPDLGEAGPTPSHRTQALSGSTYATQHTDVTRWLGSAPHGDAFGVSVGVNAPANAASLAAGAVPATSLDLGVRWRSRLDGGRRLDISAWARSPQAAPDAMGMIWETQQPTYGTRVEMQWASSRTRGLVPEFGAIGVQLQGNSRLLLRARKGGPMLYYRAKF